MDRIAEKKTKAARAEELSAEEAKADSEEKGHSAETSMRAAAAHKGAPADAYAQTGDKKADDEAAVEEEEEGNGSEEEEEDEDEEEADEEAEDASEETDEKAKTE